MDKLLIVRLSSLGDIIHAIPVAAALREAFPSAQIDWLAEARYRELLETVSVLNHVWTVDLWSFKSIRNATKTVQRLRNIHYECAIDVQGLLRSAILARTSGADRTIGFSRADLREKFAGAFYTDAHDSQPGSHQIQKNLSLLKVIGISTTTTRFPLRSVHSTMPSVLRKQLRLSTQQPFVLLIPGAGWPNKRWPTSSFGGLARRIEEKYSLPTVIDRGEQDDELAFAVAKASGNVAQVAPKMSTMDLVAVIREAMLVISGDSGPLHIAAAVGTPVVGIFGPTNPRQTGPTSPDDQIVSRHGECQCPYQRHCRVTPPCIERIGVGETMDAVERRLALIQKVSAIAKDGETVVHL